MPRGLSVSEHWNNIFEQYNILQEIEENGHFMITANQIKEHKEPRLMTKFDFSKSLPAIFKDNNLGILPVDNGLYMIGPFSLYQRLPRIDRNNEVTQELVLPNYISTIDPDNIYSEANALHVALLTGMLDQFSSERLVQTISGRMRPNQFSFYVNTTRGPKLVNVDSPQIEIDGGYEGPRTVVLVEAKNSMPEDFIIRQLYYPLRYWYSKVNKEIKTLFFTYDSGVYRIFDYRFNDIGNYNSLQLVNQKSYVVRYPNTHEQLIAIMNRVRNNLINDDEIDIQFPQADSLTRVFEVLFAANETDISAKDAARELGLDPRQGKYYIDAAQYLGFMEKKEGPLYGLTFYGRRMMAQSVIQRNRIMAHHILSHEAFFYTFDEYLNTGFEPNAKIAYRHLKNHVGTIGSEETYKRRSSTIAGWIKWMIHSNM